MGALSLSRMQVLFGAIPVSVGICGSKFPSVQPFSLSGSVEPTLFFSRIHYYPTNLTYPIYATSLSGSPHNAKVLTVHFMVPVIGRFTTIKQVSCNHEASPATGADWLFLPFSGSQGPRRVWNLNQDLQVGPEDLFSTSSQTLQKIVADMLVVFRENLNKDKNPLSMMHVDHFNSILILDPADLFC